MPRRDARNPRPRAGLPSYRDLVEFLRANPQALTAREIGRAFGLGPADGPALRGLLRAIERSGEVVRGPDRKFAAGGTLPEIAHIERAGSDSDGFPLVRPVDWSGEGEAPRFRLTGTAGDELGARRARAGAARAGGQRRGRGRDHPACCPAGRRGEPRRRRVPPHPRRRRHRGGGSPRQDRVPRARNGRGRAARRRAGRGRGSVLAPLRQARPHYRTARPFRRPGRDQPADDRRVRHPGRVPGGGPGRSRFGPFAYPRDPRRGYRKGGRADLRDLALVTIDGEDARDFDDAVWAEPDPDPANPGGWRIVVAIADVAAYVAPGSALDGEAARRGNSVYFPDRVVPMLPEALSNDLCSLRPGEDRPCAAARLWINSQGRKRRHRFERAVMRSAARLTYEDVQAAHEGSRS